ncbi:hypothetical protein CAI21_02195 [Alkalilimnicola ehrlichii]|uniref:Uncharacterized protein n=1 Tax=Alkalilimnicola ehrlichii TaxID=351052 RepID=A0A3E0X414_9GAMM|nr:hypothetical protein [Alkalilimnicola ehrlichii]RFA31442.1 hypothetical protein CAI21_02195 [Alkalilimnicola ehrlichii]RFA39286.1 hypothetical protein CAL65_00195 [Alkalilimnicola ehrlichii]
MAVAKGLGAREGVHSMDVIKLRRELDALRQQLEDERAYWNGRLDTARQQAKQDQLRQEAEASAQRRRADEKIAELMRELESARSEAERVRRKYQEAGRHLKRLEEAGREKTRSEVDRVLAAAKSSWRMAEEELARTEEELNKSRRLLASERERNLRLTETVSQLRRELQAQRPASSPRSTRSGVQEAGTAVAKKPETSVGNRSGKDRSVGLLDSSPPSLHAAQIEGQLSDEFLLLEGDSSFGLGAVAATQASPKKEALPAAPKAAAAIAPKTTAEPKLRKSAPVRDELPVLKAPVRERPVKAQSGRFKRSLLIAVGAVVAAVALSTVALVIL